MIIAVSGVPGTGKTFLAKKLSKAFGLNYVEVNLLIKKHKLYDSYDKKRKCYVVDETKLASLLERLFKHEKTSQKDIQTVKNYLKKSTKPKAKLSGSIIDSHLSHYLSPKIVDLCIITKTDIKTLKKRLEARKYATPKIKENIQAEIFDVCYEEAKAQGHTVVVVNT
jgi:broad-specificity NMP kinase